MKFELSSSGQTVRDEDLARVWPLLHEHILPNGIYDFDGADRPRKLGVNLAFNMLT